MMVMGYEAGAKGGGAGGMKGTLTNMLAAAIINLLVLDVPPNGIARRNVDPDVSSVHI